MESEYKNRVITIVLTASVTLMGVAAIYLYGGNYVDFLRSFISPDTEVEEMAEEVPYVGIPLPEGATEDDISIENDYMQQTIIVAVNNASPAFYEGKNLSGSAKHIESVYYDTDESETRILIVLDELCEYQISYYENELQLTLIPVHEMYDKVMIVDVGHGGSSTGSASYGVCEKDVALGIALRLKQMLDQTDIRVYYTRTDDRDVDEEQRTTIAEKADADLYLSIHTNADADSHVTTGIMTYCDPMQSEDDMSGKEFADVIQKAVIQETGAKDNGVIKDTGRIELFSELEIPSAMIEAGYVTNRQEALQLATVTYQEKIAKGLYNGIVEAYQLTGKSVGQVKENE